MRKSLQLLLFAVASPFGLSTFGQCLECGNGGLGAYTATSNTTLAGGNYEYTTFSIDSGVTVTVTGTQPLVIKCTGDVDIRGVLDASGGAGANGVTFATFGVGGIGVAGGGNGGDGVYSSSLGPLPGTAGIGAGGGGNGDAWSGGGGGGYASAGSSAAASTGIGGIAYGDPQLSAPNLGSGGGGGSGGFSCGSGGGGAGGGFITISSCTSIHTFAGSSIFAKGGNGGSDGTGNCGGGGGGSGGSIWLKSSQVTNDGVVSVAGGIGGASQVGGSPYFGVGGNGSEGRIRVDGNLGGSGVMEPPTIFAGVISAFEVDIANASNPTCAGSSNGAISATVTAAMGPVTYLWTPSNASTPTVTGLPAGCYSVLAVDSLGCMTTDSVCLTEPTAISATTNATDANCFAACDGTGEVVATGGTAPLSYLWIGIGQTTPTASGLCAGTYVCDVTDSVGCLGSFSVTIAEPTDLIVSETHTDASVVGAADGTASLTVTGGTPGYTYSWSPGGMTTASVAGLVSGTYEAQVVDSNGCVDTIQVVIGVLPVGVQSGISNTGLRAYPNPSQGRINVAVSTVSGADARLELWNAVGMKLESRQLLPGQESILEFDLRDYPSGTYWLRLIDGALVSGTAILLR